MTTNMTVVQRLTALQRRLIKAVHEMLPTHKACEHVRAADDEMRALPDRTVDKKGHDERIVAAQAHCIAAADFFGQHPAAAHITGDVPAGSDDPGGLLTTARRCIKSARESVDSMPDDDGDERSACVEEACRAVKTAAAHLDAYRSNPAPTEDPLPGYAEDPETKQARERTRALGEVIAAGYGRA